MDNEKFILEIELNTQYGWIKTYYQFDLEELEIFETWYSDFSSLILDSGLELDKTNFIYKIIKCSDDSFYTASNFLETFGRSFDLLEQIDGLEDICFVESKDDNSINSSQSNDSELFNDTETINNIISAHFEGNTSKVKELLEFSKSSNVINDDIISNIKNKYI
jgi:hypothetical protein